MQQKNISKIMNFLEKNFNYKEKTTLNRMRIKNECATSVRGNERSRRSEKTSGLSSNAFKILISCLLSLRAKDESTKKVSEKLFAVADSPEKIAKIPIKKLEKIVFSSGHYKKKARTIKHVSKELIEKFNSKVPDDKEKLMSIKGIGPKTANIVLAFAFGKLVIPVDVHVHVIANRLSWTNSKKPEDTEKQLEKILPKKYWKEINAILVQFGKEICVTLSPKCTICPIKDYCPRIGVTRSR